MDNSEIQVADGISLTLSRKVFTEESFKNEYDYKPPAETPLKDKILNALRPKEKDPAIFAKKFIFGIIPILQWLPRYKVKKWLLADIVSGLTIGIMQIPQGMSYALLAGQHPIHGLYNAFLPVIMYSILGTSRHTSMGTFALTSLMLGNAMASLAPDPVAPEESWDEVYDRRIRLATAMMFVSGIFLFGLSILKVGSVVVYLSDPMISGFTFGAAVHIVVSQFKSILGVSIGSYAGPLNLIWVFRDLITALINLDEAGKTKTAATVIISAICIIFLAILKELNLKYKEKIPLGLPLPGEMIVVIVGTGVSYGANLAEKYGVSIIGDIPSGIPAPKAPAFSELSSVVGYAIPIAIVGYSISVSIAKIFANKFCYEISPNQATYCVNSDKIQIHPPVHMILQELVAYGITNTICSFFSCFIAFPSMSRSSVQVESGGKTQLVGLISSIVILLVLLVVGPLFSSIPRACLAAIICVAMKGMLKRILDLKTLWKISKLDFATWVVAALGTLLLDVVYGLVAGVGFTLMCIVFRTQLSERESLKRIGETEIYRKREEFNKVMEEDGVPVGAFRGPLHYLNKESFRKTLITATGADPVVELAKRKKAEKRLKKNKAKDIKTLQVHQESVNGNGTVNNGFAHSEDEGQETENGKAVVSISLDEPKTKEKFQYLIVDCSYMPFMDSVGAKVMATVTDDYKNIGVQLLLASCSSEILRMLSVSGYFEKYGKDTVFISVHDAVLFSHNQMKNKIKGTPDETRENDQQGSASTAM